jgi:hypothetical protein
LKGAKLLNPVKLLTAIGCLNDFMRAEKHAMRIFIEEARYSINYVNQQQCRRL